MKIHIIHANKGENASNGKKILINKMKQISENTTDAEMKVSLKTDHWFIFNKKFKLYKTNLRPALIKKRLASHPIMDTLKPGDHKIIEL